jgi:cytochrome P450
VTRPAPAQPSALDWDDGLDCWVVSDPALVRQVLNHPGFSSQTFDRSFQLYMADDARHEYRELTEFLRLWFVQADEPEHGELRRPVQRMLSAGYFRSIAPVIDRITDDALDLLARSDPADAVPSVADEVSGRVMAHVIGVDTEPAVLHRWSATLSAFIGAMYRRDHAERAQTAMREMAAALDTATAPAGFPRATPADRARTTATWAMNLFGGLETTASLLGSCLLTALGDRQLWARVCAEDPGVVRDLVETVLQRRPPLRHLGRVVAHDQEFAGHRLTEGDLVLVSLVGADLLGAQTAPRHCPVDDGPGERHNVFGFGPHYCVGAPLARLEATTLLRRFAARFPAARLAGDAPVWGDNLSYVGLDHLYVDLGIPA